MGICEPRQVREEAAVNKTFHVPRNNLEGVASYEKHTGIRGR